MRGHTQIVVIYMSRQSVIEPAKQRVIILARAGQQSHTQSLVAANGPAKHPSGRQSTPHDISFFFKPSTCGRPAATGGYDRPPPAATALRCPLWRLGGLGDTATPSSSCATHRSAMLRTSFLVYPPLFTSFTITLQSLSRGFVRCFPSARLRSSQLLFTSRLKSR